MIATQQIFVIHNAKRLCSNPKNSSFHRTLKQLSADSSIKICKFDKGKRTAILNKKDYFLKLKIHPIIHKEKSIFYYIRKYLKNYDSKMTNNLIPGGSQPGKLYGLAIVHKEECPLRSVVSMINTSEYKLEKFLDNIIQPHIPHNYTYAQINLRFYQ